MLVWGLIMKITNQSRPCHSCRSCHSSRREESCSLQGILRFTQNDMNGIADPGRVIFIIGLTRNGQRHGYVLWLDGCAGVRITYLQPGRIGAGRKLAAIACHIDQGSF